MRRARLHASLATSLAFVLIAGPASIVFGQDDDAKALLAKGEDAEKAKLEDAVAIYKKLLEKFPAAPQAARAHLRLGLCYAKLGKNEDARAQLREARKLGKDDDEVQREAEKALIALPPPPEPKKDEPKKDAPKPEAPKPAPETGPRGELQAEIDKLEGEKKDLTKKAQDLEDAGKTAEAYQVRAELDKKVAQIEKKKKELQGMPRNGQKPAPQTPKEKREEKRAERQEKKAEEKKADEKPGDTKKLMNDRRSDLETAARARLQEGLTAIAQRRHQDAAAAFHEHHRLRHEAEMLAKKAGAKDDGSSQATQQDQEKAKLERLVTDLKRKGAQPFEVEERVALAKREFQLDEEHKGAVAAVQAEVDAKKIPEAEGRERVTRLDREHHRRIERLREEVEGRIHDRAVVEMDKELARRAEEMKKAGTPDAEIEQKIAGMRREMEPKLPGRKAETKLGETAASTDAADHPKKLKEAQDEIRRLKKKIEELEKENAELKGLKRPNDATAPN